MALDNLRPNYYFYLDVACSGNCGGIFFNLYNDKKVLISIYRQQQSSKT